MTECGRCYQPVYFAEAVQAIGQHWHRACFVCSNPACGRMLYSRNCNDNNHKPYCTYCYKSLFGPKGVGYGIGSGVLSTAGLGATAVPFNNNNDDYKAPPRVGYAFEKTNPVTSSISYGIRKDDEARPSFLQRVDDRFVERVGGVNPSVIRGSGSLSPSTDSGLDTSSESTEPCKFTIQHRAILAAAGQHKNSGCGRCHKTVFEAEKVLAAGQIWHKGACFTCLTCNKRLESRTLCERDGSLYCNTCYAKSFGPKGYGHGVGAGILQLHQ